MSYVSIIWFFIVVQICCGFVSADDWTTVNNVNCRDNADRPVDWWSIYKPPAKSSEFSRHNFTYLTPYSEGRWEASDVYLNSYSMLMNTIAPMFKEKNKRDMAVLVYSERPGDKGSAVQGILLADGEGGIWVTHTVPGFPDLSQNEPTFPEDEIENGHMMTCMSLDHAALDGIMKVISQAKPAFVKIQVPAELADDLPSWTSAPLQEKSKVIDFVTRLKKLNPIMVVRSPGEDFCLFEMFAKAKKVVLDVYGDRNMRESVCYTDYGVRQIQTISLKFLNEVHYFDNSTDRTTFGVSTAAHWQRTGTGPTQYWTCIGSYEEPSVFRRGSLVICLLDYNVWYAFSNLKVKEPSC